MGPTYDGVNVPSEIELRIFNQISEQGIVQSEPPMSSSPIIPQVNCESNTNPLSLNGVLQLQNQDPNYRLLENEQDLQNEKLVKEVQKLSQMVNEKLDDMSQLHGELLEVEKSVESYPSLPKNFTDESSSEQSFNTATSQISINPELGFNKDCDNNKIIAHKHDDLDISDVHLEDIKLDEAINCVAEVNKMRENVLMQHSEDLKDPGSYPEGTFKSDSFQCRTFDISWSDISTDSESAESDKENDKSHLADGATGASFSRPQPLHLHCDETRESTEVNKTKESRESLAPISSLNCDSQELNGDGASKKSTDSLLVHGSSSNETPAQLVVDDQVSVHNAVNHNNAVSALEGEGNLHTEPALHPPFKAFGEKGGFYKYIQGICLNVSIVFTQATHLLCHL